MKTKWAGLFLMTISLLAGVSYSYASDHDRNVRIIGGTPATSAAYPWMVALIGGAGAGTDSQFCGGSLIAKRWVLTASHCVDEIGPQDVNAYVGIHDLSNPTGQRIAVKRIVLHPTWAANFSDIALLELTEDATAQPVRLADPVLMGQLGVGSVMTVAGWGISSTTDDNESPQILHHVEVPLIDHAVCHTAFQQENNEITSEMLCAGYAVGGRDSCNGDSGGPLVARIDGVWTQTGVVSFGAAAGCAAPGFYGVYASVPVFHSWIAQNISSVTISETVNFGPVVPGQTVTLSIPVTNHTADAVTLSNFRLTGANAGDFSLGQNTCDAMTLAPAAGCAVTVNLNVAAGGSRTAELTATATSAASTSPLTSRLSGNAMTQANFATALDNTTLTFYTGGHAAWTTETGLSQSGGTSLRAGQIAHNQESIVLTSIEGPGTLTFSWRASSEQTDTVDVYVGSNRIDSLSGDPGAWIERSIDIPAGRQNVYWRYAKNAMGSEGADTGYLDNVRFRSQSTPAPTPTPTPTPTPSPAQPLAATGGGGGGGATGLGVLLLLAGAGLRRSKA